MKDAGWCANYPVSAALEIVRLETAVRSAEEDNQRLGVEIVKLQEVCRQCLLGAKEVAETLKQVQDMLRQKGL